MGSLLRCTSVFCLAQGLLSDLDPSEFIVGLYLCPSDSTMTSGLQNCNAPVSERFSLSATAQRTFLFKRKVGGKNKGERISATHAPKNMARIRRTITEIGRESGRERVWQESERPVVE